MDASSVELPETTRADAAFEATMTCPGTATFEEPEMLSAAVAVVFRTKIEAATLVVIEREEFSVGTKALMEAAVASGAFSVIGGGHTVSAAQRFNCCDRFSYVSTGGGALENYIMGKPLPVVEGLKAAYRRETGK